MSRCRASVAKTSNAASPPVAYRLARMLAAGHLVLLPDDLTGFPGGLLDRRPYLILSSRLRARVVPFVEGGTDGVAVTAELIGDGFSDGVFVAWSTTVRRRDLPAEPFGRLADDLLRTVARQFAVGAGT